MAEYTYSVLQTVATNGNVLFTETPISGGNCIVHRDGSGLVTLRGMTNQCRARYRVSFGGNIAVPDGGTAGAISVALSVNGVLRFLWHLAKHINNLLFALRPLQIRGGRFPPH